MSFVSFGQKKLPKKALLCRRKKPIRERRVLLLEDEGDTPFWDRVIKTASGCWEWSRSKTGAGYGHLSQSSKTVLAHRVAWEIKNGAIPAGLCVLHRCDNPPCINPDHLFLGTRADNVADAISKGRWFHQKQGKIGRKEGKAEPTSAVV